MQLGISYYPEYYPRERWDGHFALIVDGGFKRVRFGESSWASFQPSRHEFRWDVLDAAVVAAGEHGLGVVLGTPTYVPPLWLVKEHPEVLPVGADGRRTVFGARQHRCFNTPAYVEAATGIARAMAERYGSHPNVVAWQIDNELGGEQKRCHCDNCRRAFHGFLRARYGTIGELNRRWNTAFWGQQYDTFEDVGVPIRFSADLEMRHHPALELDFQRFSSDSIVRFCEGQYDVIRACTDRPITHNTDTFYWGDNVDVSRLFRRLEVAGMDVYSDRPHEIAFYSDLTRSVSRSDAFWMMEYGTRSPNLAAEFNLMQQRGCEWLFLFKFLPFPWGQEMDRKALLTLGGNPEPNYHVVREWAAKPAQPACRSRSRAAVALLYDFESSWAHWVDQWRPGIAIPERQVYPRYVIDTVYRALFECGIEPDIVFDAEGCDGRELIIAPRMLLHTAEMEEGLSRHVRDGGRLLATSDLFRRNSDNAWLEAMPAIYAACFDWRGADFPDDSIPCDEFASLTGADDRALMLHALAPLSAWKAALQAVPGLVTARQDLTPRRSLVFDQRGAAPSLTTE